MMKTKPLSIGIIGTGGIANSIHLPVLKSFDNIEITAICDIDKNKLIDISERFEITKTYSLYSEMLNAEKLDAVFILVQPDQTFRIAHDCLDAGLDVFIEKPAGITLFQTEAIKSKAQEKQRIVQIGLNRRHIPLVRHVVDIMKKSTKITYVEGCFFKHGSAEFYNGCASSFVCDAIHTIDLVQWIADGKPIKVATVEGQHNSPVANSWNSVIKFDNGVTGIIKSNYQAAGRFHNFEIHGPDASAFLNLGFGQDECEAEIFFYDGNNDYSLSVAGPGDKRSIKIDGKEIAGSNEYYKYYGYYDEDREFINCIMERKTPLVDIDQAILGMKLVDQMLDNRI
jgi:predicted dehydrogenase